MRSSEREVHAEELRRKLERARERHLAGEISSEELAATVIAVCEEYGITKEDLIDILDEIARERASDYDS